MWISWMTFEKGELIHDKEIRADAKRMIPNRYIEAKYVRYILVDPGNHKIPALTGQRFHFVFSQKARA
jgi:hypothetical protein